MPPLFDLLDTWAFYLFSPIGLWQWAALAGVFCLALLLRAVAQPLLKRLQIALDSSQAARDLPPLLGLPAWLRGVLFPFLLWVGSYAASVVFTNLALENYLLVWFGPLFGLWALYSAIHHFMRPRLTPAQAKLWTGRILRPLFLGIALLHAVGLLDDFLNAGFQVTTDLYITVRGVLYGLLIFLVFVVLSRSLREFLRQTFLPHAGLPPTLNQVVSVLASYLVLLVGFFFAVGIIGVDLTTLAVVAGGLSVGIGFGLQELINNFISGFILLFERTIVPGDVVDVGGRTSVVEDIGLRTTQVRTADNIRYIIPNGALLSDVVTSYTHSAAHTRLRIGVGASYNADPNIVIATLLSAAKHPLVLTDPAPAVQFTNFGESSLDFDLLVWINDPMHTPTISSDLRLQIWNAFKAQGIEIPFPQRDLHLHAPQPLPVITVKPTSN